MNKISLLIVLVFLGITQINFAQEWETLANAPVAGRHDDIFFVDPMTGWTINSSGEIYNTTDGGDTWNKQYQTDDYLRSIGFANSQIGWVGTIGNTLLLNTTDGGVNWNIVTNLPEPKPRRICGISVVDSNNVFACGAFDGPAIFIKTTNGGKDWISKDMSQLASTLIDCYFLDNLRGFVIGGYRDNNNGNILQKVKPVVLYTEDGGITWVTRFWGNTEGEWCWKINFPTKNVGYIAVENFTTASVLKTTDGGITWVQKNVKDNYNIEGIGFVNENVGWVGGHGLSSKTTDGGETWELINDLNNVNRFRFVNDTLAFASATTIHRLRHHQTTDIKEIISLPRKFYLEQNYPNPFNPSTTIRYTLPENSNVKIRIFNGLGQDIITLVDEVQTKGAKSVVWNGKNQNGEFVTSGVYIYRIDAGNIAESKTMLLLK